MVSTLFLSVIIIYFLVLLGVAYFTSKNANNETFYIGNKSSHWALVAFGMIGTSLSGVTFVSVPGTVELAKFSYFQVVLGYFIGYFVVAFVLLPLYYKLKLTSIYNYLGQRFGIASYKTGALFFIVSRTLGATLRLYLVINVLQIFVLDSLNISFQTTTLVILIMILLYTFKGGVKTIVWTDTLQTFFMLLALVVCVVYIMGDLNLSFSETLSKLDASGHLQIFNWNFLEKKYFLKQIIGGAFITIAMTGLDQEMMQKNISVKTLGGAQKNMMFFSTVMVIVNFLFLLLGGVLYLYAESKGITVKGDDLFPTIALSYLPVFISLIFIIGLISALFPSADGAITALTSSFCIDILGVQRKKNWSEDQQARTRKTVHLVFALVFLLMVYYFKVLNNKSIIGILLDIAGYTYGPLLGLFAFGILTKHRIKDELAPIICLLAPIISYLFQNYIPVYFNWSYQIGIELLVINGSLTFFGLWLIKKR
ncbi:MAG: sodium:solute symporter [Bacteroidia bacterium]|nr:sodium:solute symporter [Bacteroidia bacterium]MCF8426328.1 sodium:solute symporter [Bacteroidia bacterium]MCF8445773.1 sodium:solute symporter [Bacteroidia bacterium]